MSNTLDPSGLGDSDSIVDPLEDVLEPIEIVEEEAVVDPVDDVVQPIDDAPVTAAVIEEPIAEDAQLVAAGVAGEEEELEEGGNRFLWFTAAPAWLISTLVHLAIILILGLITLADPIKVVNVLTANPTGEEGPEIEEFMIQEIDPGEVAEMEEMTEPVEELTEQVEVVESFDVQPMEFEAVDIPLTDLASEMAPSMSSLQTLASMTSAPMGSRSSDMKKKLLREYGGTESSEAAVTEALKWFSRHQMPNGGWTFHHPLVCNGACGNPGEPDYGQSFNAATALALLPFMGAGQTHMAGEFRGNVGRGLKFLIANGKSGVKNGMPVLDLRDGKGNMYSHGLAAIALCEAYAMTEDPALATPAQASVNFIVWSQCKDGGWRYQPQQASGGDTSVVGWQVMALKSAHMGHLMVPQVTIEGSKLFLNKVASDEGSIYGYDEPSARLRAATTAVGLLCRMYTGWDKTHPGIQRGVKHLAKKGVDKNNIYYDYYAAQVLRHYGGPDWDKFNTELRDWLVDSQDQSAGAKGSWHFPNKGHSVEKMAGRLGSTSFATMILEVYYRHMPLYADAAAEDDFPL